MTGPRDVPTLLTLLRGKGERPALSFYRGKVLEGRLSYGELSEKVLALAGALRASWGIEAGDRVAILAPNRMEIPVLVLALLRLGAVVVPLNPASSVIDWTYILGHSGARGLCATRDLAAQVPSAARPPFTMVLEDTFDLAPAALPAAGDGFEERLAVVLYTSGTTGDPKGVALRQRNLFDNAWSMARQFRLDGTTQLTVLPLYHAHAFGFGLMSALSTGGHLVFTERLEPFTWAHVIRSESVEVTSVVPTLLPMLLAAGVTYEKVPTLRHVLVSSAPLPALVARDFESRTRIPLIQGWGLSEYTNFACCVSPYEPPEEHAKLMFSWEVPSVGPALEGTEVRVLDANGIVAGEDARGELLVRGHSTMQGYFNDPMATERTVDGEGWLHTGDEGFFRLHDGRPVFFVTGRLKETIIRDAEKYSPLRLERRIVDSLPELAGKLVVLGFPHREHGEEVGAYIETEKLDEAVRVRFLLAIDAMLLAERPKVVLWGARPVPRTHTGKIQRRKMQPWFAPWAAYRGGTLVSALPSEVSS
jgi:acyl-CoA synthetase (AMP-forming)/AMP-acid ligase II